MLIKSIQRITGRLFRDEFFALNRSLEYQRVMLVQCQRPLTISEYQHEVAQLRIIGLYQGRSMVRENALNFRQERDHGIFIEPKFQKSHHPRMRNAFQSSSSNGSS